MSTGHGGRRAPSGAEGERRDRATEGRSNARAPGARSSSRRPASPRRRRNLRAGCPRPSRLAFGAGQTLPRRMPFLFRGLLLRERRPRSVTARRERGRRRRVRASTIPLVHATVDARPRRHRAPRATAPRAGGEDREKTTERRSVRSVIFRVVLSVTANPMKVTRNGIITSRDNFLTGLHTPRNADSRYSMLPRKRARFTPRSNSPCSPRSRSSAPPGPP